MKATNIKSFGQPATGLGFCLIAFALACFGLLPAVRATDLDGVLPGSNNADGSGVLTNLTTGGFNTGCGWFSLTSDQAGSWNTAYGAATLFYNTAGVDNTATGAAALFHNTEGRDNTANGILALFDNIQGYSNTAIGVAALSGNFDGYENTASGVNALSFNTYGTRNTAIGVEAIYSNLDGSYNTAIGYRALHSLNGDFTGFNTAIGAETLYNDISGGGNVALGNTAGLNVTTANNVICIGTGIQGENVSNSCYIGNIFGQNSFESMAVYVNALGKLGTNPSSRRFKEDIKPMDKASEAICALKPVTFHYKADSKGRAQFGLIAEEVAEVNPDLVVRDKEGKPYTVRYDQVNAMLLNEFLKEHRKVEQLTKDSESKFAEEEKQIAELASALQKSERAARARPSPRTVMNDP